MFRAIIAVAAACLMMASVHAQQAPAPSRLDEIIKRGTLRVGMTGDYLAVHVSRQGDLDNSKALTSTWRRRWARRSASRSSTCRPRGRS